MQYKIHLQPSMGQQWILNDSPLGSSSHTEILERTKPKFNFCWCLKVLERSSGSSPHPNSDVDPTLQSSSPTPPLARLKLALDMGDATEVYESTFAWKTVQSLCPIYCSRPSWMYTISSSCDSHIELESLSLGDNFIRNRYSHILLIHSFYCFINRFKAYGNRNIRESAEKPSTPVPLRTIGITHCTKFCGLIDGIA